MTAAAQRQNPGSHSGDGIGRKVGVHVPPARLRCHPRFSSLRPLCIPLLWADAPCGAGRAQQRAKAVQRATGQAAHHSRDTTAASSSGSVRDPVAASASSLRSFQLPMRSAAQLPSQPPLTLIRGAGVGQHVLHLQSRVNKVRWLPLPTNWCGQLAQVAQVCCGMASACAAAPNLLVHRIALHSHT